MGESVDIVVNQTGADTATQQINSLSTAADAAAQKIDKLNTSTNFLQQAATQANSPVQDMSQYFNKANIALQQMQQQAQNTAAATKQVADASTEASEATSLFSSALGILGTAIAAIGIYELIAEYRSMADEFTNITNRLKLVATSSSDLVDIEQKLLDVSNNTRASFAETANLYQRLSISSKSLGIDQKDLLGVVQTVNQVIATSGVSGAIAARGLMQLSEGLGAGTLQGQHLKALLQDIPPLGQAIAQGLGVSIGTLREMGTQGQLTGKAIVDALQKVAPDIQKQFALMTPTIGQALTVLKNNVLQLVGTFDQVNGASGAFARVILVIANNLGTIVRLIETVIGAVAAFYVGLAVQTGWAAFSAGIIAANIRLQEYVAAAALAGTETTVLSRLMVAFQTPIAALTSAFRALWVVIAANPITLIIAAIGLAAAAIYAFGNQIKLTSDGSITLLGAFVGAWNYLYAAISKVASFVAGPVIAAFVNMGQTIAAVFNYIVQGVELVLNFLAQFIPALTGASDVVAKWSSGLVQAMKDASKATADTTLSMKNFATAGKDAFNGVGAASENMKNKTNSSLQSMEQEADRLAQEYKKLEFQTQDSMGNIVKYLNETDLQSGRLFNDIQSGAAKATDGLNQMTQAAQSAAAAATQALTGAQSVAGPGSFGYQDTNPMLGGGISTDGGVTFHRPQDDIDSFKRYGYPDASPTALTTPTPWLTLLDEVQGDADLTAQVKAAAHARHIPGFWQGGAFTVGGVGGIDSQLVQFMATPGEKVIVQTPGQIANGITSNGGLQSREKKVIVNMQVHTPDANSFRRSLNQTYLQLLSKMNTAVSRG
jgi:tape measure domain-containing protein